MNTVQTLIHNENFSNETLKTISRKRTEKGILKTLSSLSAFNDAYPDSESVFLKVFEARRINSNDECPSCGSSISRFWYRVKENGRDTLKFKCSACRFCVSPLVGTPLERSKFKLIIILQIIFRMFQSKHGLAASEIAAQYDVDYDTSLSILHRIRGWMQHVVKEFKFHNTPVMGDEVFITTPTGLPKNFRFKRGGGSERKAKVVTLVGKDGNAKAFVVDFLDKQTIREIYHNNVALSCPVHSDGSALYLTLPKDGYTLLQCNHQKKIYSKDGVHVNSNESLHALMKGMIGTVHKGVSAQHLQKYLDEVCFRFSHRYNDPYTAINSLFNALPPFIDKSKSINKLK